MVRVLICGNYGATNLGDEAILDGVVRILREVDSNFEISAMGPYAEDIKKVHGIEACDLFPSGVRSFFRGLMSGSIWKTVDDVRKADLVVLGGGGLFTDEKMMAVIIWSMQVNLFKLLRKPYICIGQSVGPLRTTFGRYIAKKVFKKSRLNIVRDKRSARLLNTLGIEGVVNLSDCAFKLQPPESTEEISDPFMVMTVRPWFSRGAKQHKVLANLIEYVYKRYGLKTVMVPFQVVKDNDVEELRKIYDLVDNKECVTLMDYKSEYRVALELIGKARLVIGMRLHSLIFASLAGKPFAALSYSTKVDEFVAQMEMSDYLVHWDSLSFDELSRKVDTLINNLSDVTETVEGHTMVQRNQLQEYQRLLSGILSIGK